MPFDTDLNPKSARRRVVAWSDFPVVAMGSQRLGGLDCLRVMCPLRR